MAQEVGATADVAAIMRAAHVCLDGEPKIFEDDLAAPLSGFGDAQAVRAALGHLETEFAGRYPPDRVRAFLQWVRAGVTVRSRFAEDCLAEAMARGVSQYVILGAGLDSFAYRRPDLAGALRIFEADLPVTQQHKQTRLAALGIEPPPNLTFVPIDFAHDAIIETLRAHGFRTDQPAFFSWLGVTWFLPEEAIFKTLGEIAKAGPGSEIVFEYPVEDDCLDPEERGVLGMVKQLGAVRGEPVYGAFAPDEMVRRVKALGFSDVQDLTPAEANARYFSGRSDDLRMPGAGHLLRARTGDAWADQFKFYDVADFPIVRIQGTLLPRGYGPQWVAEMNAFLAHGKPFAIVAIDSAQNPDHEDQKALTLWIKANKKPLSAICKGFISIEPDRAARLLKRAQGAAMAVAFGLRMKVAADLPQAEALARRLLQGEDPPEDDDE